MADVETITDGALALERCADLLRADPVGCNMVASVLRPPLPTELTRVSDAERTLAVAVAWPPGITLARMPAEAHQPIADSLSDGDGWLWGAADDVLEVSRRWGERTGGATVLDEMTRVYGLRHTPKHRSTTGAVVAVGPDDSAAIELAARWARAFGDDVGHGRTDPFEDTVAQMLRAADEQRLLTWRSDDSVVAQLLVAPERFGVVRIGGVYTPPEQRDRGFASDLTAAVTAEMLRRDTVDEVILNTQSTNARTNRLYPRLGFTHAYDALSVHLRAN
ncbi:MAG: GNAT family N-acetyltransferase [Ilumatobacter sp.]